MHVPTTAREPKAESPRTRIVVSALMARAVLIACATMRAAPLAELARPARNRGPAITGANLPNRWNDADHQLAPSLIAGHSQYP